MGRIIVTQHSSLDGVVEAPGPGDVEDYRHKGWIFDLDRDETGERYKLDEALAAEVLLLGRVTYETLGRFWPKADDPLADKLNAMPKYVLSTTLERADWTSSTVLRGDLVTEVTRLRETIAGDILVYGSIQLVQGLIEHGLFDELRLMTYPVLLGSGRRLFGESPDKLPLRLVDCRTFGGNVVLLSYAR